LTYFDLAFASEAEAGGAIAALQDLGVTGEWHLAPAAVGEGWRLSLSSERSLTAKELARLGGTLLGEPEGGSGSSEGKEASAADPASPDASQT